MDCSTSCVFPIRQMICGMRSCSLLLIIYLDAQSDDGFDAHLHAAATI
jgi:hypothetical protein